jgi:hypothetical protein
MKFITERLPLAIFLHATDQLRFLGCESTDCQTVAFVFSDPNSLGLQVVLEFDRGANVPATAVFASQKFLRRKMSEALNNRRNGRTYEYNR